MKKTFAVLGGDRRQIELARLLARDGQQVFTCALGLPTDQPLETAEEADVAVLPVPLSKEPGLLNGTQVELERLWELLGPEQLLCAGQVEEGVLAAARSRGLTLVDYLKREELAVANAVPTALPIGHKMRPQGCPPSRREMLAAVSLTSRVMDMSSSSMRKVGPAMLTAAWMVWPMPKMGAPTQMSPGSISPSSMA